MKAVQADPQHGRDGLPWVNLPDPGDPGPSAIPVHATSLGLIVDGRRHQVDLIRSIDAVRGHPPIERSSPHAATADAFQLQKAGGHFGKIVLEF
jgi:hypothetical protein